MTNLYEGFLQRGPDSGGLSWWTGEAGSTVQSRQHVLDAFAVCDPFKELAAALYRETFWLVGDQLGTPRMVADRTGSLAGIKRHDYLPFGEELYVGTGGRTSAQGYGAVDNVRRKFNGYERDGETGLDYAQARYYASGQGRFTGVDAGAFTPADPQNWNRYSYVQNNPLKFIDPTGNTLTLTGHDANAFLEELERHTGYQLSLDATTGRVTIDKGTKRDKKVGSKTLADKLKTIIQDEKWDVGLEIGRNQEGVFVDKGSAPKQVDMAEIDAANAKDHKLGAIFVSHVLAEQYEFKKLESQIKSMLDPLGRLPHIRAFYFESRVLSDYTGTRERPRKEADNPHGWRFEYTSVAYDILYKNDGATVDQINPRQRPKVRK